MKDIFHNSAHYESYVLIASNDRKAVEEFILRTRSPEHGIHMQVVWEIVEGIPSETGTRVRCITPNEVEFDKLVRRLGCIF